MEKDDTMKETYTKTYIENGAGNRLLVAPMISGSQVLDLLGFAKQGDIYPDLAEKQVTDIGWGFSSLAFEVAPSVQSVIVVDPIFQVKDLDAFLEQEKGRATKSLGETKSHASKDLADILASKQEIIEGIEKRKNYQGAPDAKIICNPSFAQDIQGIAPKSQDIVFVNFVLDKLHKGDKQELIEQIRKTLRNALDITKPGGMIMGVHDIGSNADEIIIALDNLLIGGYDAQYTQKGSYLVFSMKKRS